MGGTIVGFVCGPRLYVYKGWLFEFGYTPWPLKKDGELRKRAGRTFYRMLKEWQGLPPSKRKRTRVGGGCSPIVEREEMTNEQASYQASPGAGRP